MHIFARDTAQVVMGEEERRDEVVQQVLVGPNRRSLCATLIGCTDNLIRLSTHTKKMVDISRGVFQKAASVLVPPSQIMASFVENQRSKSSLMKICRDFTFVSPEPFASKSGIRMRARSVASQF